MLRRRPVGSGQAADSPSSPKKKKPIFEEQRKQGKRFLKLLNLGAWLVGWAHELFAISIAIMDVVSDVLVAWQFYSDGHTAWGHTVVASILLSSALFTFGTNRSLRYGGYRNRDAYVWPGTEIVKLMDWLQSFNNSLIDCVLVFPFAQLHPLGHYVLELTRKDMQDDGGHDIFGVDEADNDPDRVHSSKAAAEEASDSAANRRVVQRMQSSFRRHLERHIMFYIETVVESLPQCIIQMLAMSMLNEATPIQLLSVALSLISIVSKAYVVCQSFNVKVMVFKFALAAFDILALFYVYSTFLSPGEPAQIAVPGFSNWSVSFVTYALLIRMAFVFSVQFLLAVLYYCVLFFMDADWHRRDEDLFIAFFLGTTCFIPAFIAQETVKLSTYSILSGMGRVEVSRFVIICRLFSFIEAGGSGPSFGPWCDSFVTAESKTALVSERTMRLRYILYHVALVTEYWIPSTSTGENRRIRDGVRAVRYGCRAETEVRKEPAVGNRARLEGRWRIIPGFDEDAIPAESGLIKSFGGAAKVKVRNSGIEGIFKEPSTTSSTAPSATQKKAKEMENGILIAAAAVHAALVIPNLAFPFVHVWWVGFDPLNVLQLGTLAGMAAAHLVIALLSPIAWRAIAFTFDYSAVTWKHQHLDDAHVKQLIEAYLRPTTEHTLRWALCNPSSPSKEEHVEKSLIPSDVVSLTAEFLASSDLAISQLDREECRRIWSTTV